MRPLRNEGDVLVRWHYECPHCRGLYPPFRFFLHWLVAIKYQSMSHR
jgi:hypothetical protein